MDFIKMKQDLTKVTGANVSVRVTDESAKTIWEAYDKLWRTPYGRAKSLRVDAAKGMVMAEMKDQSIVCFLMYFV